MAKTHTLRLRVTKAAAGTLAAATLFGALGMSAESAAAAPSESTVTTSANEGFGGLTASQWQEIAAAAERAGDQEGAKIAREAAEIAAFRQNHPNSRNPHASSESPPTIAKKIAKFLLREGRHLLPNWLKKWADKVYDLIDFMDTSGELAIATFLVNNGLPGDVALDIARWIMLFA